MVWYGVVWYGMVWYGMVWHGMVWYGMVWYGMENVGYGIEKVHISQGGRTWKKSLQATSFDWAEVSHWSNLDHF